MAYIFSDTFKIRERIFQPIRKNTTVELLKCSVLISISGIFRVYLASLLLQTNISFLTCLASGLIIYSVYTLDRSLDSEEDSINRKELIGSKKEIGLAASILTFVIGSYVFAKERLLAFAFLPLITGFLYSKGIKIGKFTLRLKGGLGIKNFIVGLTWGAFIAGVAGRYCTMLYAEMMIFIFYGMKTFINSIIDDFKDIKGDTIAGIRTLPVCLGEQNTRNLLSVLQLLSHLVMIIALFTGLVAFEPLIIICSFICGIICICKYTNEKKYLSGKLGLTIFKDGESALIVALNLIT